MDRDAETRVERLIGDIDSLVRSAGTSADERRLREHALEQFERGGGRDARPASRNTEERLDQLIAELRELVATAEPERRRQLQSRVLDSLGRTG